MNRPITGPALSISYLVLVYDPALKFLVPTIMAPAVFHNLSYGKMFQSCTLREGFAVSSFANARGSCYNYVGPRAHDVTSARKLWMMNRNYTLFRLGPLHKFEASSFLIITNTIKKSW